MLIGICGKKQAGKNTVCKMLKFFSSTIYPKSFEKYQQCYFDTDRIGHRKSNFSKFVYCKSPVQKSFAKPIKEMVVSLTGCSIQNLEIESFKNSNLPSYFNQGPPQVKTYRQLMQFIGTDLFQPVFGALFWVNKVFQNYKPGEDNWIITDVRFEHEAHTILDKGGLLLQVFKDDDNTDSHISENVDLSVFNPLLVDNTGELKDLFEEVRNIYRGINGKD